VTDVSAETEQALAGPPPRKGFLGGLAVFGERRTLVMLALGFAAGLPNLLIFDTLSAWLREEGVSLEVIGFFALATLTYALKFVWAPVIDRIKIPGLTRVLGHRRSWMLVSQAIVILGLWLIAGSNPSTNLSAVAAFAVMVGFAGATQDIAMDAWRIEVADSSRQGAMAAAYQWGYRGAIVVSGAVPLYLAELYNWNLSYGVMAALMLIGVAAVLLARASASTSSAPSHRRPALAAGVLGGRVGVRWLIASALVIGTGLTARDCQAPLRVSTASSWRGAGSRGRAGVCCSSACCWGPAAVARRACPSRLAPGRRLSAGLLRRPFADSFRGSAVGRGDPCADLHLPAYRISSST
jgi:PAT family beta-lactamase induction signal transducer AmpG